MKNEKNERLELLEKINADFSISRGNPSPLGVTLSRNGYNFAVFCPHAKTVSLVLFSDIESEVLAEFLLDPYNNRTGNIWHVCVDGIDSNLYYGYRIKCDEKNSIPIPESVCKENIILLDPYTVCTVGGEVWGKPVKIKRGEKKHTFRLAKILDFS